MEPNNKLPEDGELFEHIEMYKKIVSMCVTRLNISFAIVSICVTRLNISFAISVMCQFMTPPQEPH